MPSLEDRTRLLEDRAALTELIARYAMLVAQGKGAQLGSLFTSDGRFRAGAREFEGKALKPFFAAMKPLNTIPLVGNVILDMDGDDARGQSTLFARMPKETVITYSGYYDDVFRRVRGKWKFVSRDFTFYHDSSGNAEKP